MASVEVENVLLHRRSYVTESRLHAYEPRVAYVPVLAHEALWVDSGIIPLSACGSLVGLVQDGALCVENSDAFFDKEGRVVPAACREDGSVVAAVQKRLRIELVRGAFGEYTTQDPDLRHLIHENISIGSSALYRPVVEQVVRGDEYDDVNSSEASAPPLVIVPDHSWKIDYASGILSIIDADPSRKYDTRLYLTGYFYCGRVGLDARVMDPSTDDIPEGVTNRYFTRELFQSLMMEYEPPSGDGVTNGQGVGVHGASTDDLVEGVHNKYLTDASFDVLLHARTLDDLSFTDSTRAVTADVMRNLRLSLGHVPEMQLTPLLNPPAEKTNKLYVEHDAGANTLYFSGIPLTGKDAGDGRTHDARVGRCGSHGACGADMLAGEDMLGVFNGRFHGRTVGVHSGDVIGNVTGFVSDLGNHPIIQAKLLGNGEGHWVGTVNADVVGKFEGHAKIVTGSIDNAYHVTIGTYDATASMHIRATDRHVRLSTETGNVDGADVVLACTPEGRLDVACAAVETDTVHCRHVHVSETLTAGTLNAETVNCVGIVNNFYGIRETGAIVDVTDMSCEAVYASMLSTSRAHVDALDARETSILAASIHTCSVSTLVAHEICTDCIETTRMSVSSLHVNKLAFDRSVFAESADVEFNTLSVASAIVEALSVSSLRVRNIEVEAGTSLTTLTAASVHTDTVHSSTLSVSRIVFDPAAPCVSIPASCIATLSVASLYTMRLETPHISVASCFMDGVSRAAALLAGTVVAGTMSVSGMHAMEMDAHTVKAALVEARVVDAQSCLVLSACVPHLVSTDLQGQSMSSRTLAVTHRTDTHELSVHRAYADAMRVSDLGSTTVSASVVSSHDARFENGRATHMSVGDGVLAHASVCSLVVTEDIRMSGSAVCDSTLSVSSTLSNMASIGALHSDDSRSLFCTAGMLSVAHALCGDVRVHGGLSVGSVYAGGLGVGTASCSMLCAPTALVTGMSVHALYVDASLATPLLSVSNARCDGVISMRMSCSALEADTVHSARARFDVLSVHSIVGIDLQPGVRDGTDAVSAAVVDGLLLSVQALLNETVLSIASMAEMDVLTCSVGRFGALSCADMHTERMLVSSMTGGVLAMDAMSANRATIDSLSVGTLHGFVLQTDLSVTGSITHLSTSAVTSGTLSCAVVYADSIVRRLPHVSDTTSPAVMTTNTGTDFMLFEEEARHCGDLMVEGSLYVTDSIFMGTSPSMNLENVNSIVASSISVGELAVGTLTGIGGGTLGGNLHDFLANVLSVSPHDTFHEGNVHVDGNLLVSGIILTGASNRLAADENSIEVDGSLSLSGSVVVRGIDLLARLETLENEVALLRQRVAA